MLVVIDTLRADRMSACGYHRPTTPWLDGFIPRSGDRIAWTCDARAPGTWTLPSHASFFTGLMPSEHGLLLKSRPLGDEFETLAETWPARRYQTAILTANKSLSPGSNILQGFQHLALPETTSRFRGGGLRPGLQRLLEDLDPSKPLFLVVNLFDAHDPYNPIPKGVDWVAPRPSQDVVVDVRKPASRPIRYMRGVMPAAEARTWLRDLNDTYDHGITVADQNLGAAWNLIRLSPFGQVDTLLVVTSDHGEHLGEHQMVRHNGVPYQEVARIPLLFRDTSHDRHPRFEGPISGLVVYHLLRDGRLPDPMPLPVAASIDDVHGEPWREPGVALWPATNTKLVWRNGESVVFDLETDPGEERGAPLNDHPQAARLAEEVQALQRAEAAIRARRSSSTMLEELQGLGYVE